MKKKLMLVVSLLVMMLGYVQNTWAKCETVINIPATACVGVKYDLSINDDPCDCIKYADVYWEITDPGGSVTSYTGSPLTYVFTTPGTYKVCVKWTDICTGESFYECRDVIVTKCCDLKVDIPATICAGTKYDLSVNDDPCDCIKYAEVEWIITDPGGSSATYWGSPLSYVFSTPGVYTVCVKWKDYCTGETHYECHDVIVKKCCETTVDIPATLCSGEKYNLNISNPCDCIKYDAVEWIITDPGGSTTTYWGSPLSYVFTTPGTYTVCVKWKDECTGETHYECHDVIVKDCCDTKIDIPTSLCAGAKYNLSISDAPCDCIDASSITWTITDPGGTATSYSGNPLSYVFTMVGTYKVCVKWHNHCTGETKEYCQDVVVKDCCETKINIPTTICAGSKYLLSVTDDPCDCINADEVVWTITDPGGATTSYTGNPLSYVFSMVGTYKVCVKWHNHCTGETKEYCQDVIVKDCCDTRIDIPASICAGTKYVLSITTPPCDCIKPTDVVWTITDPGGTTTSYTGNPLSYVFSTVGVYKVCVKWFNHCTGETKEYCQDVVVKDCCETKVSIPGSICVGTKFNLSVSDAPCDCITPSDVVWTITAPDGTVTSYTGNPLSYVFSMIGTYKVCVKWFNHCTGETKEYCQDVVAKDCCSCDMKISENTSTTDFAGGVIIGTFHLNSGSKKVVGVDISVPFWNYSWDASGCKFNCDELNTGYPLGNIIKYTDLNGYYPTHAGCFDEWWAREVDWTFPTPQSIDQDFTYVISVPHTDCKIDYYYCVKVLLHYDDCTVCECTFCFKGNEVVCSCEAAGSKPSGKSATPAALTDDNVSVYPNPNSGSFTVQMQPTASSKVITVVDMTGKTIMKSVVSGEKANLELKDVANGTYMVVITSNGKSVSKRVVINSPK